MQIEQHVAGHCGAECPIHDPAMLGIDEVCGPLCRSTRCVDVVNLHHVHDAGPIAEIDITYPSDLPER